VIPERIIFVSRGIIVYVFGCRLSLVRLCDSDFGITPVDDITIGITYYYYDYYWTILDGLLILWRRPEGGEG